MKRGTKETLAAFTGAAAGLALTYAFTRNPVHLLFALSTGAAVGAGVVAHIHERAEQNSAPERRPEHA